MLSLILRCQAPGKIPTCQHLSHVYGHLIYQERFFWISGQKQNSLARNRILYAAFILVSSNDSHDFRTIWQHFCTNIVGFPHHLQYLLQKLTAVFKLPLPKILQFLSSPTNTPYLSPYYLSFPGDLRLNDALCQSLSCFYPQLSYPLGKSPTRDQSSIHFF